MVVVAACSADSSTVGQLDKIIIDELITRRLAPALIDELLSLVAPGDSIGSDRVY